MKKNKIAILKRMMEMHQKPMIKRILRQINKLIKILVKFQKDQRKRLLLLGKRKN